MSGPEEIVRIAAKGDGVTAGGRHVPLAVPGDIVHPDGSLEHGPHHARPACRHFGTCGGCQLQHADEEALRRFVTDRVVNAAAGQDMEAGEVLPTFLSPPSSRRRATLHGLRAKNRVLLGFREQRSHKIIDIAECPVLRPELFALVQPLRKLLGIIAGRGPVDVQLTLTDQGADCMISGVELDGLGPTEAVLDFAQAQGLARLTLDQGYGAEAMWEPDPVTVTLGSVAVPFPAGSFLQPGDDGEAALVADAIEFLAGSQRIADLFSGLGTFAFALAGGAEVTAVEAARDAHLSCRLAAGRAQLPLVAEHRDLFRNPLQPDELARFDAVVLDPPRAGAREQVAALAGSAVERICYVSCNPSSWARDARQLVEAGYRLERLRPVGQFRWSTHVELTSLFTR